MHFRGPCYATLIAILLGLAVGSCGSGEGGAAFQSLARGFRPTAQAQAGSWSAADGPRPATNLVPAQEAGAFWLESHLPADSFQPEGHPGIWRAPRPFPGSGIPAEAAPQSLTGVEGAFHYVPRMPRTPPAAPGAFCATGAWVMVIRHPDLGPPGDVVLREYLETSQWDGTHTRIAIGPLEADGIPLLPNSSEEIRLDVPPNSALTFWTSARNSSWSSASGARAVFRVKLEGELLFEHKQSLDRGFVTEVHTVPLPPEGGRQLAVEFSLSGDPAHAAIFVPTLHPREVGRPGARPWTEERPDIVLLQGDTFRADNLVSLGGDERLTPVLNDLALRSRNFTAARSTASWTLPAHASLFTGLLPHQTHCTGTADSLHPDARTLAELLRAQGYRTVAITDQGYVSRSQGFAQGFEWFLELGREGEGSFGSTLDDVRTQLAVDDGRPLFLFVQTYRAHTPYGVSDATRSELGEHLGLVGTWEELAAAHTLRDMTAGHPQFDAFVARAEALYRAGVHDLDRGIGTFLDMIESAGLLDAGVLIFTSDHGEAFGEHGHWGHGDNVFEEEIRVPLLVHGPGITPGEDARPVSLLDVPATILHLAGIAVPQAWGGRDLTADLPATTLYAVTGNADGVQGGGPLAAMRGEHKLILPEVEHPDAHLAFDLGPDPLETQDRAADAPWVEPFYQDLRRDLPGLLEPLLKSSNARRSAAEEAQLQHLGYGD